MLILGIETSCDETAVSVAEGEKDSVKIISNIVSSQIEIHQKYNGVVPEIAAREHVLNIIPVVNEALKKAGIPPLFKGRLGGVNKGLKKERKIDAIAVTVGPGLITSLLVGVETARTLSYAWNIPLVAVNHIEGHIYANFIALSQENPSPHQEGERGGKEDEEKNIKFPAIILTVSGGHTLIALMEGHGKIKIIGETRDDAAGEAFDKAAKLMNLGYPGGPIVSKMAEQFITSPNSILIEERELKSSLSLRGVFSPCPTVSALGGGRRLRGGGREEVKKSPPREGWRVRSERTRQGGCISDIILPRPMIDSPDFDFSFSGLKTALLYQIQKDKNWENKISEYCYEFQQAIIDVLIKKTIKAAKKYNAETIMLAGGVAANKELRRQLKEAVAKEGFDFYLPELKYTTDNAAMIASAGYFNAKQKKFTPWDKIRADCNFKF